MGRGESERGGGGKVRGEEMGRGESERGGDGEGGKWEGRGGKVGGGKVGGEEMGRGESERRGRLTSFGPLWSNFIRLFTVLFCN